VSPKVNHYEDPNGMISLFVGLMICGTLFIIFLWCTAYLLRKDINNSYLSGSRVDIKSIWILCTFIFGYIAFLLVIKSLFDPNIVFDNRTFSPLFLTLFITIITTLCLIKFKNFRFTVIVILLIAMIIQSLNLRSWLLLNYYNGIELNDKNFKARSINLFIKNCDKKLIFSCG